MNQEKEKQYREEFEAYKCCLPPHYFIKHKDGSYAIREINDEWLNYLAGRKKGDEEVKDLNFQLECAQAVGVSYGKTIDRMEKEIAQLREEMKGMTTSYIELMNDRANTIEQLKAENENLKESITDDYKEFLDNKYRLECMKLKEQLKRERECVDFYASGVGQYDCSLVSPRGSGGESVNNLHGKRARSVQAQRKDL